MKKEKQPAPVKAPDRLEFESWVVVGLDLSLSRTGYFIGKVCLNEGTPEFTPLQIGSLKPETASSPVWLRSSLIAKALLAEIHTVEVSNLLEAGAGLLICFEAFTPRNDYLSSINRIVHATFFDSTSPLMGVPTYILSVNASTLRSLMGLTKTGTTNKKENIAKAYTFIDKEHFPALDTDSCDAVLLAQMASYAATSLLGQFDVIPDKFKIALGSMAQEVKGKGTRMRIQTKGLFYRPEYWYALQDQSDVAIFKKNASLATKKLSRSSITYTVPNTQLRRHHGQI